MSEDMTDNERHCKYIADTLNAIAAGTASKVDGDIYDTDEAIPDGTDENDIEPASMWDYFGEGNIYGVEYRVNSDKVYKSVSVMIAYGGPNIYVDTHTCKVELYWWGDRADAPLTNAACEQIDAMFEEIWRCT